MLLLNYDSYVHYVRYMWSSCDVCDNVCNDIVISCDFLVAMLLFTFNRAACVGPRCLWYWDV